MNANVFDALMTLIKVSGNWRDGKAPTLPTAPRPLDDPNEVTTQERKRMSVKQLYRKFKNGPGGNA